MALSMKPGSTLCRRERPRMGCGYGRGSRSAPEYHGAAARQVDAVAVDGLVVDAEVGLVVAVEVALPRRQLGEVADLIDAAVRALDEDEETAGLSTFRSTGLPGRPVAKAEDVSGLAALPGCAGSNTRIQPAQVSVEVFADVAAGELHRRRVVEGRRRRWRCRRRPVRPNGCRPAAGRDTCRDRAESGRIRRCCPRSSRSWPRRPTDRSPPRCSRPRR